MFTQNINQLVDDILPNLSKNENAIIFFKQTSAKWEVKRDLLFLPITYLHATVSLYPTILRAKGRKENQADKKKQYITTILKKKEKKEPRFTRIINYSSGKNELVMYK